MEHPAGNFSGGRQGSQDTLTDGLNHGMSFHDKIGKQDLSMLSSDDPDNPQNWPILRKLYVSAVASFFAFTFLFGGSSYTAGIPSVVAEFGVSPERAILGFSLFLFGIIAAPIVTPHLSEQFGRSPVYFAAIILSSFSTLGASRADRFAAVLALRFLAGFFGGPIVVLIEGTFADVWSATFTGSYLSFVAAAQYLGAATGGVLGGALVQSRDWRWTQYVTLMMALVAILFGVGVPETYPRQIIRNRARRMGVPHQLPPAQSGETILDKARLTVLQPVIMLFTEPIVMMLSLFLSFNFGVLMQFFVLVPNVLNMLANFGPRQSGLTFLTAVGGVAAAGITGVMLDRLGIFITTRRNSPDFIEHRMMAAIMGSMMVVGSLFAIGVVVTPAFPVTSGVIAVGFYVYGTTLNLIATIGYLFDLFAPPPTLSALTVVAVTRVATAGWFPLIISVAAARLMSRVFFIFGAIGVPMMMIPIALFIFGPKLRARSRFSTEGMSTVQQQSLEREQSRQEA